MNSGFLGKLKMAFFQLGILHLCLLLPILGHAADHTLEKELEGLTEQSRGVIKKIRTGGKSAPAETAQLKELFEQIRALDLIFSERFRVAGERAESVSSTAVERHKAMVESYRSKFEEYRSVLDEVPAGGALSESAAERLEKLLDQALPKKKARIIGTLPYKVNDYPAAVPKDAASVQPAYRNGAAVVSAADLQGAPEAPISKEIAALAQSLDWNPVAIYEWVKNNVETEWYWGSMKGAEETLRQKSGNDADQAALLVSLMRASGYPSRYVRGVIEFFPGIDRLRNLTGIEDSGEIAEFLRHAGIPFKPVMAGARIDNFQIEHLWVEVQVPYGNYRGALKDGAGKTWVALDSSIKATDLQWNGAADLDPALSFTDLRDRYLSAPSQLPPLDFLKTEIDQYLNLNRPGVTYGDLLRTRSHTPEVLNILPASLQFREVKVIEELTTLPEELLHTVKVVAADSDGKTLFDTTLRAFEVSNRSLVLSYEPEEVVDHEIIDSYGGLDNTPSYLVRLRPVLKLDGERVAVGTDGLPMGSDCAVTVSVTGPRGTETVSASQVVGNVSVLSVVAQKSVTPPEIAAEDKDAEHILYEEALKYAGRWSEAEDALASLLHLSQARPLPSVALVGGVVDVAYILGTPHGFSWKGVYIDAALRRIYGGAAKAEGAAAAAARKDFMFFSALQGSVLEHRLFEDDLQVESVSTARIFGEVGGAALTIDSANIDATLPTLPYDDDIKADIAASVAQKYVVRVPAANATFRDWTGTGYIKENPETGEAGYMLSGMIAGGMTAWSLDKWPDYYASHLSTPYAEPPNTDPMSGMYIQKITTTDLQPGTVGEKLPQRLQVRVTDQKGKPVKGAAVTFTIMAGGGNFAMGGSVTSYTNSLGIASAPLTLGQHTSANPTYVWADGYTFSQQVGENIVNASLSSGVSISKPFTAYAFPKAPARLNKTLGDGVTKPVLTYTGSLSVLVEDIYGNPISNRPVNFAVQPAVSSSSCPNPNADIRQGYLLRTGSSCALSLPLWGSCGTQSMALQETSSHLGTSVDMVLGGAPEAEYKIVVSSGSLVDSFSQYTESYGNCDGQQAPENMLYVTYSNPVDEFGNSIFAGKAGSTIPVTAKVFYLREGEKEILEPLSCSTGLKSCKKIVGNRSYYIDTNFKAATVTFGGQAGAPQGGGIYKAQYTLAPGLNNIPVSATATVTGRKTYSICNLCNVIQTVDFTATTGINLPVYGVNLTLQQPPQAFTNMLGYSYNNVKMSYTIQPAEYKAGSAYVQLFKNGGLIETIAAEKAGAGSATIAKGFTFDPGAVYEAQVVLNYLQDTEIRSDKKSLGYTRISAVEVYDPANVCNKAPGKLKNELIMAVDPSGKATPTIHLTLDSGQSTNGLIWAVTPVAGVSAVSAGNFASGDAMATLATSATQDYVLRVAVDSNGNGVMDYGDDLIRIFNIKAISSSAYNDSYQFLYAGSWAASPVKLASSFLFTYLGLPLSDSKVPIKPTSVNLNYFLKTDRPGLSHNVGQSYLPVSGSTDVCQSTVKEYIYDNNEAADIVANSTAIRRWIDKDLAAAAATLSPGKSYVFPYPGRVFSFANDGLKGFSDANLALGGVEVDRSNPLKFVASVVQDAGRTCIEDVRISGAIHDLYDFDYYDKEIFLPLSRPAATLEFGWNSGLKGTTSTKGEVHINTIILDKTLYFYDTDYTTDGNVIKWNYTYCF